MLTPGQPNHLNVVELVRPDKAVTSPPLERVDSKPPSTFFSDSGRRLETMIKPRFCCSSDAMTMWLCVVDGLVEFTCARLFTLKYCRGV